MVVVEQKDLSADVDLKVRNYGLRIGSNIGGDNASVTGHQGEMSQYTMIWPLSEEE